MYPIPNEALDDRLGIVGTAGSGKTYGAGTAVERILARRGRVIIPDALGVWWGLRLNANGKHSAFEVVIFGGPHADIPITEHAGAIIGETVAGMKESAIIDLSALGTKAAERRFMLAFLTALYRKASGEPVHLIFDEADLWAPQQIRDRDQEPAKLLGMMETIIRRGRVKGFIPWLISQRPAVVNKDVLSQVAGLVAFKLTSPQDTNAIEDWVRASANTEQWKSIRSQLPALPMGTAVVWVPGRDVLSVAPFPIKATFDSSRTPKRGEKATARELKPLNVGALRERLASVEQDAKTNDPKALRAELAAKDRTIADLRRQIEKGATDPKEIETAIKMGHAQGATDALAYASDRLVLGIDDEISQALAHAERLKAWRATVKRGAWATDHGEAGPPRRAKPPQPAPSARQDRPKPAERARPSEGNGALPIGERRILTAIAQNPAGVSRDGLGVLVGYKRSSRNAYLQRLFAAGLIESRGLGVGQRIAATAAGVAALGSDYEPLPTGDDLRAYWLGKLPEGERRIFEVVAQAFPRGIDRESVREATGYQRSSCNAYLQRLKARELIATAGGEVQASGALFG